MKMKSFMLLLIVMTGHLAAQHQELASIFDEGNKLYLEKKYDEAINRYESILNNGYESGEIYFNLGNAYFKSGKIQNAILNFERAKKLIPNDEDLQFNLQLARAQLIDKVDPIPELFVYRWIDAALTIVPLSTMIWMMYVLFLLAMVLFSFFVFARTYEQRRYSLIGGIAVTVLLVIGTGNFLIQSYRESNTESAIVMTDVANIKSAPDKNGNDLFVIHRGIKVRVLDNVNQWNKIRLDDGKVGWIPSQQIEII